jgi:hypothetical protein
MKKKPAPTTDDGLVPLTARIPARLHAFLLDMRKTRGVAVQHAVKEALEAHYREQLAAYVKRADL